jgi:DNA helicase HerA-like ATPase
MSKLHIGQADDGTKFEIERLSLTKHAVILGATGSGKTVLSKVIVEEAALLGIPTFAIDPKGDIGNLAFQSPDFGFSRWSEKEADALKLDRAQHAKTLQQMYGDRAAEFSVSPKAAGEFAKVPVRIFTPKSSAGLPVGISPDLSAPEGFSRLLQSDVASAADLLDLTSYSLLRLAGYGEDDRKEITFVSAFLEDAWKAGQSLAIKDLIRRIENPPISTIGSLHVSDVVGDKDRRKLATRINLLISDPKLRSWSAAEPLDFAEIFSKPSVNVLDLRNIQSEQEKHLFVELVLQQLFQWLIKQGSAQTLRYLLYFDEIAGYCPPVREPPSKKLLLLLIKQARAFGLGLLLASQNAVDLDYKVISNANVRFIGRLGAQRDIQRVSVGLELDSHAEKEIARLKPGEFFCNTFDPKFRGVVKSRWTLTYHRGPLENGEIAELMAGFKGEQPVAAAEPVVKDDVEEDKVEVEIEQEDEAEPVRTEPEMVTAADAHDTFLMLEKKFEPKDLASFVKLGNNVRTAKVVSVEQEERFHPVFEINASVFEKTYAKQSLERIAELAAFGGELVKLPEHALAPQRHVPADTRRGAQQWKAEIEKRANELRKELEAKFDVVMEEKRKENIAAKSEKPKAKIANIDASAAKLQEALNANIDAVKAGEKIYKELKKEKAKKSRLISVENRTETKKQKILLTRRKIEQLHTDRKALEEKLGEIEREEKERFHDALAQVRAKSNHSVSGWLVETTYRASVLVNGKEHHGDVQWSAYTGQGTWGRCSTCSLALESGSACSCGNLMCNRHLAYCKTCLAPACKDHRALCYICDSIFCSEHSIKCELCSRTACSGHSGACTMCSRKVCNNCSQKKGLIKREIVCRSCSG